jgi:hypothetical protein
MKIGLDAQVAIRSFAQSLIAGDLGPEDSRDGRSQLFLKNPGVVGQAMAIFLDRLEIDETGRALNYDRAEQRVRQFIRWELYPPEPPFNKEELGVL